MPCHTAADKRDDELGVMLQDTFLSFWYWALSILFWAVVCNWTFGVPNELVSRAKRGGADSDLFERFARRNMALITKAMRKGGSIWGAMVAFVIALLATFAVRNDSEAAQGALFILVPLVAMGAVGGWRLKRLSEKGADYESLLKLFLSERFRTAVIAGIAIVAAYAYATVRHGPGWTEALFRGL
ncbi:MAG: hypothetical protein AAF401_08050 [Pseudomonadota bacterium]